ncbi:MAG: hypothetical protein AVDCRST_MAG66-820, partial [uncultured Pseudonocardia sp.]
WRDPPSRCGACSRALGRRRRRRGSPSPSPRPTRPATRCTASTTRTIRCARP